MRRTAPILLIFAVLQFTATEGLALPPCPQDQDERYHNCYGTYVWDDGNKYVGEWKDDKAHGQGTITFTNGDKFVGEYRDDKQHGQGTYLDNEGTLDKYIGDSIMVFFGDPRTSGKYLDALKCLEMAISMQKGWRFWACIL